MTLDLPTLIISRRARQVGSDWNNARSWFGGRPELGDQPWPRGAKQTPLYFLAQIDLEEVARSRSEIELSDGALAFFLGRGEDEGTVVHVPRAQFGELTEPPTDAPAVFNPQGDIFPEMFSEEAPRAFPRWPVDITAEAQPVTQRQFNFSARDLYKTLDGVPRLVRWHSAHYYAACLRRALEAMPANIAKRLRDLQMARERLDRLRPTGFSGMLSALKVRSNLPNPEIKKLEDEIARREASVAEIERPAAELELFVQGLSDYVGAMGQWEVMSPEAVEALAATFERGKKDFRELTRFHTPHEFADLETETLLALATADDETYATMPLTIRTLINTQYLLPTRSCGWHQMFGTGVEIQGNAAAENEGNVMLLQLVYDDMMHWRFGDNGAYQFWISPEDLRHGNWAAAHVTFECH